MLNSSNERRDNFLLKFNLFNGTLHLGQAIAQLYLFLNIDDFKDFKLPLNTNFLTSVGEGNDEFLQLKTKELTTFRLGYLIFIFLFITSFFHYFISCNFNKYITYINENRNPYRWVEYSITSTIMIWVIALLFGIYDISTLVMIGGSNFVLMYMGMMMENLNKEYDEGEPVIWTPFLLGCVLAIFPWISIALYLIGDGSDFDDTPNFVYALAASYFVFYQIFAINQFVQYKNKVSYVKIEKYYQILSLASKSTLAWIVFGGLNQPNKYN